MIKVAMELMRDDETGTYVGAKQLEPVTLEFLESVLQSLTVDIAQFKKTVIIQPPEQAEVEGPEEAPKKPAKPKPRRKYKKRAKPAPKAEADSK